MTVETVWSDLLNDGPASTIPAEPDHGRDYGGRPDPDALPVCRPCAMGDTCREHDPVEPALAPALDDRLDAIRARTAAASPGPWFWRGNTDSGDPSLAYRRPGHGSCEVLSHVEVTRSADDARLVGLDDVLSPADAADARDEFLHDPYGEPRTDDRLAFSVDGMLTPARDLAVYEVCRDARRRSDPRVYRADVVGVRHPDAVFIEHSRADVEWLLAEVDRLRAALTPDQHRTVPALAPLTTTDGEVLAEGRPAQNVRTCGRCGAERRTAIPTTSEEQA